MNTLAPVVVGALLALMGSVLVQLVIVPRVDARRRRHERWEGAVADLGERLAFDDVDATDALSDALFGVLKARDDYSLSPDEYEEIVTRDGGDPGDNHPWFERIGAAWDPVEEAYAAHHRLMIQVGWLVTKVEADAANDRNLSAVHRAHSRYCRTAVGLRDASSLELSAVSPLSEAAYDGLSLEILACFDRHAKARAECLLEVKRLLVARNPRKTQFTDPYREALERRGLDPDDPNVAAADRRG